MSRSSEFWNAFDYQHATFSSGGSVQTSPIRRHALPSNSINTELHGFGQHPHPNVSLGNHPSRTAGAAQLVYNIFLFANRHSITEAAKKDIVKNYGISIGMALHGRNADEGVLIAYSAQYPKLKDGMGKKIGSYGHDVAFLGTGANPKVVYERVMFGSRTATLSSGKTSRVPDHVNQVVCYMWIFRR